MKGKKFADSKFVCLTTSSQPGVIWYLYIGDKKCKNCENTADHRGVHENVTLYACSDCMFIVSFTRMD